MIEDSLPKALALREKLHSIPELSCCETETKKALMAFLKRESDLEIVDCGAWFYAAHRENEEPGLAFRADMDAIPGADGPFHGSGHDGHSAVMAALAASTGGKSLGKNLFFFFQHAEEIGAGAKSCCELFEREKIEAVFGFHNCPGFEAGRVLLLPDTFACASKGLILSFTGSQSHAAHPENGRNPIFPMAALFSHWEELTDPGRYRGLVLATPVGMRAGERAFGVSAGCGEIDLTLRAWYDEDLQTLTEGFLDLAGRLAAEAGVTLKTEERDVFPATRNSAALYPRMEAAARSAGLATETPPEPFRWSEDFGNYAKCCPSFFCGIGAGKDAPGLHTPDYRWNDAVSEAALRLFSAVIGL